jgi:hypothetical protein
VIQAVPAPGRNPGWHWARRARRDGILAVVPLLIASVVLGACGDPGKAAAGIVIAVDAPAGEVTGFTLRTQQGETLVLVIGALEVDGAAFVASHLTEHAVTLQPIAVAYRVENGVNVVHRMVDAPWAAPSP